MNLDSDGKRSYFYNAAKYERDSAYNITKNTAVLYNGKKYDQNLGYIVEKNYAQKSIKFYDKYKTANLLVIEDEAQKWNIEKEFLKINNINCQKQLRIIKDEFGKPGLVKNILLMTDLINLQDFRDLL
jgi:GLPGLI family protein